MRRGAGRLPDRSVHFTHMRLKLIRSRWNWDVLVPVLAGGALWASFFGGPTQLGTFCSFALVSVIWRKDLARWARKLPFGKRSAPDQP